MSDEAWWIVAGIALLVINVIVFRWAFRGNEDIS